MVTEQFRLDWPTVLVSSFGAVVVRCDGRGSGFQGTNLLHRIQKRLGVFEEQDQKDALGCVELPSRRPKWETKGKGSHPVGLLQCSSEGALHRQKQGRRLWEGENRGKPLGASTRGRIPPPPPSESQRPFAHLSLLRSTGAT